MVTAIKVGCMVIGRSGKSFLVDRVDGEFIYSGKLRIAASAVIKVTPPRTTAFKLGDRVTYIGSDANEKRQYTGELKVWDISNLDGYTCLKPNGRLTSWIEFENLELSAIESN